MANIANVKVKSGNLLELSGSSVSISGSGGLNLHTQNGGIVANAGTGSITLDSDNGTITLDAGTGGKLQLTGSTAIKGYTEIKGNLVVSGNIEAHRLDIFVSETVVSSSVITQEGNTRFGDDASDVHEFSGSMKISGSADAHAAIKLENGYFSGSGAGLTNIPNSALSGSGAITINGASTGLGDSIITVAASSGLKSSTAGGTVTLQVSASGDESGLVIDGTGVALSSSVVRNDRNANFGAFNVSASYVSASTSVLGAAAQFGTLSLTNDLAIDHGGTGISTAPSAGKLLIGSTTAGQYVVGELTSSGGTVSFDTATDGKIDLSVSLGAISAAGTADANVFTKHNTFNSISVTGSAGLTLTSAAPLVASGSVEFKGSVRTKVKTVTANYTLDTDDNVILAAPSADLKITLTEGEDGRQLVVKKINENTNRLYLSGSGCLIDTDGEFDMYGPLQSVNLVSSGSNWFVL